MPEVRPVEATDEALWVGTCKEFLPESVGRFGAVGTPLAAGRLPTGGGDLKEEVLGSPADGVARGV